MNNLKFILKTALLLVLTVMFQMLRPYISIPLLGSNFIIGSLVNASLAVSSVVIGAWGGIIISIAASIIAFLQQHIKFVWMIPIIAGGNTVLVLIYRWLYTKYKWVGIILSALAKFLVIFGLVKMCIKVFIVVPPLADTLSLMFSWPQIVTALIGGILAVPVLKVLINRYDIPV